MSLATKKNIYIYIIFPINVSFQAKEMFVFRF